MEVPAYALRDRDAAAALAPPPPPAASSALRSWTALLRLKDESVCTSYEPAGARLLPADITLPLDRTLPPLASLPLDENPRATAPGTCGEEADAAAPVAAPAPASFDAR